MKRVTDSLDNPKQELGISIHTLCEEGDFSTNTKSNISNLFQSTPSVKRVTCYHLLSEKSYIISIHTLCEEGDRHSFSACIRIYWFQSTPSVKRVTGSKCFGNSSRKNFNPHPLWRGWHDPSTTIFSPFLFQSTPSVKRVTDCPEGLTKYQVISIHTLCEEGDPTRGNVQQFFLTFQSTPSVKRVTSFMLSRSKMPFYFNPHPLWRGWHKLAGELSHS